MRRALLALACLALTMPSVARAEMVWQQRQGFVLGPSEPWEGNSVQEPTVLNVSGKLHMFYTGGFYGSCLMGHATSGDGVNWTKDGEPVLGGGRGGERYNACHSNVYYDRGRFWALYSNDGVPGGDHHIHAAVSIDGRNWQAFQRPVLERQGWERPIANTFFLREPGRVVVMYEAFTNEDIWEMGIATGPDLWHLTRAKVGRLKSLQRTGMYGGPWLVRQGRTYRLYFHASRVNGNLPTRIYTATSRNLTSWTVQEAPIVDLEQDWQVDQVADPSLVTWRGKRLLYFDGLDNNAQFARIGVATLAH